MYGVTKETYERVTRVAGSYKAFRRGLALLFKNNIRVRFKAMALRSNICELPEIAKFCREKTKDYFRFDPFLHLRLDRDQKRNAEIKSERLSFKEIVSIEKADSQRYIALEKLCAGLIVPEFERCKQNHLFQCGVGYGNFNISYDGYFRLCASLSHQDCVDDLKERKLKTLWEEFVPQVLDLRSKNKEFLRRCRKCSIINLCLWCPAHAYLEAGELDAPVDYFCEVAHARADALGAVILKNG